MKKIEKIWPNYLKTKPDTPAVEVVKNLIKRKYPDFGIAYRNGLVIAMGIIKI